MSINVCDCGGSICADGLFDCKFKGNFKPKIMNEYRGFKVGDKVDVLNENKTTITTGTIERFGDRKLGGCATPDTMEVIIGGRSFDMLYLVSHELIEKLIVFAVGDKVSVNLKGRDLGEGKICYISGLPDFYHVRTEKHGVITASSKELKKLPKYVVGDVVRSRNHNKVLEISEVAENHYRSAEGHFMTENYITPFDGFRIGDTVWTAKRGKGKIVDDRESMPRRFVVEFENGLRKKGFPKLSNLFPTERKMIESLPKDGFGFTILRGFVTEYDPTPAHNVGSVTKKVDWLCINDALKNFSEEMDRKFVEELNRPTISRTKTLYPQLVIAQNGRMTHKSKFGMGEMVSYAGCVTAAVDKIHFEDGKFKYDLRTNSCPSGLPEHSILGVYQWA